MSTGPGQSAFTRTPASAEIAWGSAASIFARGTGHDGDEPQLHRDRDARQHGAGSVFDRPTHPTTEILGKKGSGNQ